ncbi:hypothetical protein AAFF_G00046620 [Aldrovandia affinis]|uniref:Uncharacterized protein n=1 Tax=Aldrovandia affinis TaxID=143900 RepID=A0AAD7WET2_9TELE|nr:hypothetical protein AAFF_G00046620 [Aldrovandia affinis]
MAMSQGTYTFLTCFGGFWLVWAVAVVLCCFCNTLQRRVKRHRERRLRQQAPDTLPSAQPAPADTCSVPPGGDVSGKPPCYEEAVLMEDTPPPYSTVLGNAQGGLQPELVGGASREPQGTETNKMADGALCEWAGRDCSSLIHLPTGRQWDCLLPLRSTVELNCNNFPNPALTPGTTPNPALTPGTTPTELRLGRTSALPTAFPMFGRSTAV